MLRDKPTIKRAYELNGRDAVRRSGTAEHRRNEHLMFNIMFVGKPGR